MAITVRPVGARRAKRLAVCALVVVVIATAATPGTDPAAQQAPDPHRLLQDAEHDLRAAVARFDRAGIAAAADQLRRVLELNPSYAAAHVRLAEALLWLNDTDRAAAALADARRLQYTDVEVPLLEARLAVENGDLTRAAQRYDDVLATRPYNEEARVGRAVLALAAGPTDTVVRDLERLISRYPQNLRLLVALASIMDERERPESFRRYLALALRYHPDSASVQYLAARAALEDGDADGAAFHADNAVAVAPTYTDAWHVMARAAYLRGETERAISYYEELIQLNPEDHRAWYARGHLTSSVERIDAARMSWERALEIRPDYEPARIARENTLIRQLPLEDPRRAEAARAYRASGRALQDRFLSRRAESHYRRGLQLNPFDPVLRRRLAELYLQQGMEARYLQELEVLRRHNRADTEPGAYTDQELSDRLEAYRAALRSTPARRWEVDQFTASRPRTTIRFIARQSDATTEPGVAEHVATYVTDLLQSSQNVEVLDVLPSPARPSEVVGQARGDGADLVAFVDVHLEDRSARIDLMVVDASTTRLVAQRTIRTAGNGRLERAAVTTAQSIDDQVTPRGTVLQRRFERAIVSLGRVDGLAEGQNLRLTAQPAGTDLGTAEVAELDDLVSVVVYRPEGPDNLTVGDTATPVPEDAQDTEDEEAGEGELDGDAGDAAMSGVAQGDQTSRWSEQVQQLFRLR